jgi:hypothetical protein
VGVRYALLLLFNKILIEVLQQFWLQNSFLSNCEKLAILAETIGALGWRGRGG